MLTSEFVVSAVCGFLLTLFLPLTPTLNLTLTLT